MVTPRLRMLAVDDESDILDFLERATRHRFAVTRSSHGEEALAVLEQAPFDLLITDHKMPRMTGLELLDRIGDRFATMVRVLLSGYTDVPEVERAGAIGRVHHYVVKPVDSRTLLAGIDHAFHVHAGTAAFVRHSNS
jgi:YesN/AraC family two-component response regulator